MEKSREINHKILNVKTLTVVGIALLILISAITLLVSSLNSNQSIPATPAGVYFAGEYRIGEGDWRPIKEGEHISSTKGDVTLRGNFHLVSPGGEYIGVFKGSSAIAIYTDHINITIYEEGREPYVIDHENPLLGASACGEDWTACRFISDGTTPIEIVVHNPHSFGNENAIDKMLSSVAIWSGVDFEKELMDDGKLQRNTGLAFMIVALIFLGTGLFSSLIHLKNSKIIWMLGVVILFAGLYFTYASAGIYFWSQTIVFNTTILGIAMMFYMLFLSILITLWLDKTKAIGAFTCLGVGVVIAIFLILSTVTKLYFYDFWLYWAIIQSLANIILIVCLVKEALTQTVKQKCISAGGMIALTAFGVDLIAIWLGAWEGGVASMLVFGLLFAVAMIIVLMVIPRSINAVAKAKELETEKIALNTKLTESRVSTMMSQIRPHFIYNTLGSIEQLCELDPQKAGELVHNFAKYLRGNFRELDNPKPILMSQEMEHVHHYISIENVRFPDMTFSFEMNSNDFKIPALTVQPIVENAVKHGLMKLQKGGVIRVVAYETDTHYHILVEDNGGGFDTGVLVDDRKHLGIRNIRGRLKAMVNGTLEIQSTIGVGTKVLISVPKEEIE